MTKELKLNGSIMTYKPSRTNMKKKKKKVIFIPENWLAKVGSQKIPGLAGKFVLGVQNAAGKS